MILNLLFGIERKVLIEDLDIVGLGTIEYSVEFLDRSNKYETIGQKMRVLYAIP